MFIHFVVGFVLSTLLFYQLDVYPVMGWSLGSALLLCLLIGMVFFRRRITNHANTVNQKTKCEGCNIYRQFSYLLIGFIIGFQSVFWQSFFKPEIPANFMNKTVWISGEIKGLVLSSTSQYGKNKIKFRLAVSSIQYLDADKQTVNFSAFNRPNIQLNWYSPGDHTPRPGHFYQFGVKLKPNHGLFNPGSFDYESYLWQKGIAATGYVRTKEFSPLLVCSSDTFHLRTWFSNYVDSLFATSPFSGVFKALTYGDKSDLSADDWALLNQTGTIHLMVISGLHIGLMASIGFALFVFFWRRVVKFSAITTVAPKVFGAIKHTPSVYLGAVGALIFATAYMVLAGYAVPTQRAWVMVVVVVLFVFIQRQFQPYSALALSGFLVVLWQPASVLGIGFWLSFLAVWLIFMTIFHPNIKPLPNWKKALIVQLVLFVGMMPLLAFYFNQVPLYSIIANLFAVPFVTLVGLPLLLITVVVSFISTDLSAWLMMLNDEIWTVFWQALRWVGDLDGSFIHLAPNAWQLSVWYLLLGSVVSWVAFKKNRAVWVGVMLVFFIVVGYVINAQKLAQSTPALMTVFDVGQGQAVLFETTNHTVLFDTGARWSDKLDGGKMVIIPYLRAMGKTKIDLMIVSHSDLDHAGGALSILNDVSVLEGVSGQADELNARVLSTMRFFKPCYAGQQWRFDSLVIDVLSPAIGLAKKNRSDNDSSCVIKVSIVGSPAQSIMVTGDLSKRYENKLVGTSLNTNTSLQSAILIAGHHGSKTSTGKRFLDAVNPSEVIFTTGYLNRFSFPHRAVVERLEKRHITWWNTACEGAVLYQFKGGHWQKQESYRAKHGSWYHHACSENDKGKGFQ